MIVLNQRGGRKLVRTIDERHGTRIVPPADYIIDAVDRGATPAEAVAAWWAGRPASERAAARADGYYVG